MEVDAHPEVRFENRPEYRPLTHVLRRDGSLAEWDQSRILEAVLKAGRATAEFAEPEAALLTAQVIKILGYKSGYGPPHIEAIQDTVEQVLISNNHLRTARAYIVYRDQHARLRDQRKVMVDVAGTIDEYIDRNDWRIKANANQGYSLGGLILNISGKMVANYWLSQVYTAEIGLAHREGDYHIHDLDMLSGYCAGWSLRTLLREGFNGVPGKVEAKPPKHLTAAVGQMVNFLGTLQNEWAGAQAFSSFDTYLAPYVRADSLRYEQVKQSIQEFIYNLNVPSRWGTQTPFTNVTFDWVCPQDLRDDVPVVGGEEVDFTYGDLQAEMDMINKAYMEVMAAGDAKGRIFTFPIPTYNVTPDFHWDHPNCDLLFEMTAKYGLPYFQNFLNSDLSPHQVRSMCCRLQLDLRELQKRGNGLFGSAEQTGSIGVVTINCARLGFKHRGDWDGMIRRLDTLLDLARDSLETKRKVVQRQIDGGLLPFTKRWLGTLRNHFSTIGINGLNEAIRNFTEDKDDLTTPDGHELGTRFLDHIRARMVEFQEGTGHMYNLEATPAEGTTYRFAREDKKRFPDILQAGTDEAPYYTNSSQLPVGATDDPFWALTMQEGLQRRYTGGTVFHLFMGERIPNAEQCKRLVRRVLERFRVPYITVTPTFSVCPSHGYLTGEQPTCPECGGATEVWTRVMGYHRPVSAFNTGKKSEYAERQCFGMARAGVSR